MTRINVEITDTFGGEANYSWWKRESMEVIECLSRAVLVRKAKALMGWTGLRCVTTDYGLMIELRPQGMCQVMFITPEDYHNVKG